VQDENGSHIIQVIFSNSCKERTMSARDPRGEGQLSQIRTKGCGSASGCERPLPWSIWTSAPSRIA